MCIAVKTLSTEVLSSLAVYRHSIKSVYSLLPSHPPGIGDHPDERVTDSQPIDY